METLNDKILSLYPKHIKESYNVEFDRAYRQKITEGLRGKHFNKWVRNWIKQNGVKNQLIQLNVPPMFYPAFEGQSVLTIGLNPSLTVDFFKELPVKMNDLAYQKNQIEELLGFQRKLKYGAEQINYFKEQEAFFNELNVDFAKEVFHYDLIQIRHTDSSGIERHLRENHSLKNQAFEHLNFVLNSLRPKAIFVFNAAVSGFIKKELVPHQSLDPAKGCYLRNEVPLIFANQLSGGATSKCFRELLVWNSKRILSFT